MIGARRETGARSVQKATQRLDICSGHHGSLDSCAGSKGGAPHATLAQGLSTNTQPKPALLPENRPLDASEAGAVVHFTPLNTLQTYQKTCSAQTSRDRIYQIDRLCLWCTTYGHTEQLRLVHCLYKYVLDVATRFGTVDTRCGRK